MPKVSALTAASKITGEESIPVVQGGASRKATARDFHPFDYVIDGRTDAQAGANLRAAADALNTAGEGGEIKVMAGSVNLGTSTLTLDEGVVVSGVTSGWRSLHSNSNGTRLYWTGPTDGDSCVKITGNGAGIRDMMIYAATNLAGNIVLVDGGLNGVRRPHLTNVRINGGPTSTTYWGLVIRDAYHVACDRVNLDVSMNGVIIDTVLNPYNVGNSAYSDVFVFQNADNTIGWKIESPSLTQRTNLMTFHQCGALCMPTFGTGCTGVMLRGASRLNFVGIDIENHATLLDIGIGGGNGPASHNTFIGSYLNTSAFTTKNVVCDATSVNNVFVGGRIAVPSGYTGSLDDDLTQGGADPNLYTHVAKSPSGYH